MEKYSVEKKIGEGSFGSVWKVMNLNGDTIAVKVIDIRNERINNFALSEVRLLKKISNPCFVSLACYYGSFIQDNKLYIEMEYIDGLNLLDFSIQNRRNPNFNNNLLAIIKDITPGLIYLHTKGVIHRDIKPENIIIQKNTNQPKLIDIGLGCITTFDVDCKNKSKYCCIGKAGTAYFMAPETLLEKYSSEESDVWSLGASIYFSATNTHVFEPKIKTVPGLIFEARKEISLIKTNDHVLNTILKEMLDKNVDKRIKDYHIIDRINFLSQQPLEEIVTDPNEEDFSVADLLGYIY